MNKKTIDFDKITERRGTDAIKYAPSLAPGGRDDLLPMWVADMDFPLPEAVLDEIRRRVDHGIFGYTMPTDSYHDTLENWFKTRYGYEIKREWNTVTPGIVHAVSIAIRALTPEREAVMITEPVYHPFARMIRESRRRVVNAELRIEDGRYTFDLEAMRSAIRNEGVRIFILCSPHNPVGRVWTYDELSQVAALCAEYNVIVIADEIHCDFLYPGITFTPWMSLPGDLRTDRFVLCTSAGKTFNLPGLAISNILIVDEDIRERFREEAGRYGLPGPNPVGLAATEAVYRLGTDWLNGLLAYLDGNLAYVRAFLNEHIPQIKLIEPEGTYLIWLDCKGLELDDEALKAFFTDRAKIWVNPGDIFGKASAQYVRMNIATPRSNIEEAMRRLLAAVRE